MQGRLLPVSIERKRVRYEKPAWACHLNTVVCDDLSASLPTTTINLGYRLRFVEFDYPSDPVFLYDRERRIVHEWGYIPSLVEVFEVCKALGL